MKTKLEVNGGLGPFGKRDYDKVVIADGLVRCFKNGQCFSTYSVDVFCEGSLTELTIEEVKEGLV